MSLSTSVYRRLLKKCTNFDRDISLRTTICSWPRNGRRSHLRSAGAAVVTQTHTEVSTIIRDIVNGGAQCYFPLAAFSASCPSDAPHTRPVDSVRTLTGILRSEFEQRPANHRNLQIAFECLRELRRLEKMRESDPLPVSLPEALNVEARQLSARRIVVPAVPQELSPSSTWPPVKGLHRILSAGTPLVRSHFVKTGARCLAGQATGPSKITTTANARNSTDEAAPPMPKVQLLYSHPQASGFDRLKIMLLVHVSADMQDAVALMLNSPLCDDETDADALMLRWAVPKHFAGTLPHPLFQEFLANHVLLTGGEYLSGHELVSEDNVFVLHRSGDGVPGAVRISETLWLDGDKDTLVQKLRDGSAKVEDMLLFVGFKGWGHGRLNADIKEGKWLLVEGKPERDVDDVVVGISRHAQRVGAPPLVDEAISEEQSLEHYHDSASLPPAFATLTPEDVESMVCAGDIIIRESVDEDGVTLHVEMDVAEEVDDDISAGSEDEKEVSCFSGEGEDDEEAEFITLHSPSHPLFSGVSSVGATSPLTASTHQTVEQEVSHNDGQYDNDSSALSEEAYGSRGPLLFKQGNSTADEFDSFDSFLGPKRNDRGGAEIDNTKGVLLPRTMTLLRKKIGTYVDESRHSQLVLEVAEARLRHHSGDNSSSHKVDGAEDETALFPFVEAWRWAYHLLGEPFTEMARNQSPYIDMSGDTWRTVENDASDSEKAGGFRHH